MLTYLKIEIGNLLVTLYKCLEITFGQQLYYDKNVSFTMAILCVTWNTAILMISKWSFIQNLSLVLK